MSRLLSTWVLDCLTQYGKVVYIAEAGKTSVTPRLLNQQAMEQVMDSVDGTVDTVSMRIMKDLREHIVKSI